MELGTFVFFAVSPDPNYCRHANGCCAQQYTDGARYLCRLYGELKETATFHVVRADACIENAAKVAHLLTRCAALAGDVVAEFATNESELVDGMFADDVACLAPFMVLE